MLFLALACAACGYKLVRHDEGIGGAETVAVKTFDNETNEPGVEAFVSDAIRREVLERGVRIVEDVEAADLVIEGDVRLFSGGRSFSSVVLALDYEVTMVWNVEVRRGGEEKTLWVDRRALRETEFVLASADVEALRRNRREAIIRLSAVLADRLYDSLAESARELAADPLGARPGAP